jgi:NAD(P)-dependent dehydrogenase (short-subunit alcohol dehydrogenase family)
MTIRTAAITGSASGIGAALRQRLEADGWRVVGIDLAGQEIDADLSTPEGRSAAVAATLEACDGRLDALVPCAGLGPQVGSRRLLPAVNYFGAVAMLDGLLPALSAGERAAAVAICSNSISMTPMPDLTLVELMVAGDEGTALDTCEELDGPTVYAMTKVALGRTARRRVQEWADAGVRLNLVAPGPVTTPLLQGTRDDPTIGPFVDLVPIPLGRVAEPVEIAGPIAFLLGPEASNVHGSILFVDGGSDALFRPDHV